MYLSNFRVVSPGPTYLQKDLLEKLALLYRARAQGDVSEETDWLALFLRFGCKPETIHQRSAVIMNFLSRQNELPKLSDRQNIFQQVVTEFLPSVVEEGVATDEVYHVSCTGYLAPSVAQVLIAKNPRWRNSVASHLYHMGCYAAIPAVRLARGAISLSEAKSIKILHTELCSLHFGYSSEPQAWVIQSLFADGLVSYDALAGRPRSPAFEVLTTHEEIVPESLDKMSWIPGEDRFHMTLAKDVPNAIGSHIVGFVDRLLKKVNAKEMSQGELARLDPRNVIYAIHPGGPRILEEVSAVLKLEESQWRASREVFRNHGNMSSSTLPTIWSSLLEDSSICDGTLVVSLAFGPGLTFAGSVFRVHRESNRAV
jgi:predicted naringenin-chalcone synthase